MLGVVYILINPEENLVYVGSCLEKNRACRYGIHRYHFARWKEGTFESGCLSTFKYFDQYGFDSFVFQVMKTYEITDVHHLRAYEQLWMNKFKMDPQFKLINKKNALNIKMLHKPRGTFRTTEKQREYHMYQRKLTRKRKLLKECLNSGRTAEADALLSEHPHD